MRRRMIGMAASLLAAVAMTPASSGQEARRRVAWPSRLGHATRRFDEKPYG